MIDTPSPQVAEAPAPQEIPAHAGRSGEEVYKQACAACHDNAEATRSPSRDNLKGMSFQFVNYALTNGKMKDMAAGLTADERAAVGELCHRTRHQQDGRLDAEPDVQGRTRRGRS